MRVRVLDRIDHIPRWHEIAADNLIGLRKLPDFPDRYFIAGRQSQMISLEQLVMSHLEIESIKNANRLMFEAYHLERQRRAPIAVRPLGGEYLIVDGNATFGNAVFSGWERIVADIAG